MKAVIMAGGEGTRLRPLTNLRPKPMVPIVNRPVMEHIIGLLKWHGIDDIVATLQFMPQVVENYFGDGDELGVRLSYALEDTPLGTAGSVKNAECALDGETFVVISGDALTDIDLTEVIRFHKEHGGAVTIALKRVPDPLEYGVVMTNAEGRIERFLEKPTWGEVFSDTINTGIYVCEPEVLEFIPAKQKFDFSAELFPALMAAGKELYGCVVDGYWTDIGSLATYVQAHRDVLDGAVGCYIPGFRTREDVWVGEGAQIDPDATISSKAVIGANTKIRAGARIGPYTILGDGCYVGTDADLERTIVWSECFIGARAMVRGAVLGRSADIRSGASVESGVVIGDEATIGHGAYIGNDVQIYPYKRVEAGAMVTSSIIWENTGVGTLFTGEGQVSGLVNVDITPELALKLAQAYATTLPTGSHVVLSRDSSRSARMIKRAMVAGLNSCGVHVRDLRVASPPVTRLTARDTRCVGGVHVGARSGEIPGLVLQFFDHAGLELSTADAKKVERLYFRQDFRRAFFDEVGEIIYPPRALEYYSQGLLEALRKLVTLDAGLKVVADMGFGLSSIVMPQLAGEMGLELFALSPFLDAERTWAAESARDAVIEQVARSVRTFSSDIGFAVDIDGETVTLVTPSGRALDGDTALHAMIALWCANDTTKAPIGVPRSASYTIEAIAARTGHTVVRTGRSTRALSTLAASGAVGFAGSQGGGYIYPTFLAGYDAIMTMGVTVGLLAKAEATLDEIVDGLPEFHLVQRDLFCPQDLKGAVMRSVTEAVAGEDVELTEGVRVQHGDGWAIVLPHANEPLVRVFAEGPDAVAADALADRYAGLVAGAIESGRSKR